MTKSFSRISSYISNDNSTSFLIWKEEDLFPVSQNPVRIDFMGIFIPTSGKMIDEINLQTVTLDKKHILVFTHNHVARMEKSEHAVTTYKLNKTQKIVDFTN